MDEQLRRVRSHSVSAIDIGPDVSAVKRHEQMLTLARDAARDSVAGLVSAVVLIANIVSFGALMFQGDLSAGIPPHVPFDVEGNWRV